MERIQVEVREREGGLRKTRERDGFESGNRKVGKKEERLRFGGEGGRRVVTTLED